MAGLLDDFIKQFADGNTANEEQAHQFHERFVSTRAEDQDFDNSTYHDAVVEQLGQMPHEQLQQAATNIAQAPPEQKHDLLSTLLGALGGGAMGGGVGAGGLGGLSGLLGLGTNDPRQMGANDIMRVMDYARREKPEALRTAVQQQPWLAKALGNPLVMSALATVATRLVSKGLRNFGR